MAYHSLAIALARALVAGAQVETDAAQRIAATLGKTKTRWMDGLARRFVRTFAGKVRPRENDVIRFLLRDPSWKTQLARKPDRNTASRHGPSPRERVAQWPLQPPLMQPVDAARTWSLPEITTIQALSAWLGLDGAILEWLADAKGLSSRKFGTRLHHYHYRVLQKRSGGIRIIEAPQARLKAVQRRILVEILERVPAYYSAAHGFVKGRSVRTFVEPHLQHDVVLKLDLQNFFPTISRARVQALFRTLGYPESVADVLGELCTNTTPRAVFTVAPLTPADVRAHVLARELYGRPHLPQGAPTSPLIANLCAFRLDCRLTGLADWAGAVFTRYADDLAISGNGEFARNVERYATQAAAIAMDEGWSVQHHKTRIMRRGVRQKLAGVVVNEKLNVSREHFDLLKAILTNCVRHGPISQNRNQLPDFRAHLRGRVDWVTALHPARGRRLKELFNQIEWDRA